MFEGFQSFTTTTSSDPVVKIHGIHGGTGPALLLLHGFPESHHIWYRVAPQLTSLFSVVALDLRGYGASSKLSGSSTHIEYAKSAMARDCVAAMEALGFHHFYICAHDRGARVAHKLCVDFPHLVRKAIFLDICPTLAMYDKTDFEFAKTYFHWFFLIQKAPLPETLISRNPRVFAELFMGGRYAGLSVFDKECLDYYIGVLESPDAVHAMCEDYRASATVDLDEARKDIERERFISCPLRVLWAEHGVVEKCFDALQEWNYVTSSGVDVSGHSVDCGHYIPEEEPDIVVKNITEFFR